MTMTPTAIVVSCPVCRGWVLLDASPEPDAKEIGEFVIAGYTVETMPVSQARERSMCKSAPLMKKCVPEESQ